MFEIRYTTLAQEIEAGIRAKRWSKRLPGTMALARELNAAPRTVSKAIKLLAEQGKVTVQGTRGTFITAGQRRPMYGSVAVVTPSVQPRKTKEIVALQRFAAQRKYDLLFLGVSDVDSSGRMPRLSQLPVDGYIFTNSTLTSEHARALRQAGIPFVSTSAMSSPPGVSWVSFDDVYGLQLAYEHLRALGHHRIAYVTFRTTREGGQRIFTAYRQLAESAGSFDASLWQGEGDYLAYFDHYLDDAWRIYGQEAARRLIQQPSPPTALIASDYGMAMGALEELKSHGIDVPKDFSIVGRAIHDGVAGENPYLTHLSVSTTEKLQRAVQVLIDLLQEKEASPVQEWIKPRLVQRYSTAVPSAARSSIQNN